MAPPPSANSNKKKSTSSREDKSTLNASHFKNFQKKQIIKYLTPHSSTLASLDKFGAGASAAVFIGGIALNLVNFIGNPISLLLNPSLETKILPHHLLYIYSWVWNWLDTLWGAVEIKNTKAQTDRSMRQATQTMKKRYAKANRASSILLFASTLLTGLSHVGVVTSFLGPVGTFGFAVSMWTSFYKAVKDARRAHDKCNPLKLLAYQEEKLTAIQKKIHALNNDIVSQIKFVVSNHSLDNLNVDHKNIETLYNTLKNTIENSSSDHLEKSHLLVPIENLIAKRQELIYDFHRLEQQYEAIYDSLSKNNRPADYIQSVNSATRKELSLRPAKPLHQRTADQHKNKNLSDFLLKKQRRKARIRDLTAVGMGLGAAGMTIVFPGIFFPPLLFSGLALAAMGAVVKIIEWSYRLWCWSAEKWNFSAAINKMSEALSRSSSSLFGPQDSTVSAFIGGKSFNFFQGQLAVLLFNYQQQSLSLHSKNAFITPKLYSPTKQEVESYLAMLANEDPKKINCSSPSHTVNSSYIQKHLTQATQDFASICLFSWAINQGTPVPGASGSSAILTTAQLEASMSYYYALKSKEDSEKNLRAYLADAWKQFKKMECEVQHLFSGLRFEPQPQKARALSVETSQQNTPPLSRPRSLSLSNIYAPIADPNTAPRPQSTTHLQAQTRALATPSALSTLGDSCKARAMTPQQKTFPSGLPVSALSK